MSLKDIDDQTLWEQLEIASKARNDAAQDFEALKHEAVRDGFLHVPGTCTFAFLREPPRHKRQDRLLKKAHYERRMQPLKTKVRTEEIRLGEIETEMNRRAIPPIPELLLYRNFQA